MLGLNLMEPGVQKMKNRMVEELKRPVDPFMRRRSSGPEAPVWLLTPFFETQSATLAVELGKESKLKVQAALSFADAERADRAAKCSRTFSCWAGFLLSARSIMRSLHGSDSWTTAKRRFSRCC